MRSRQYITKYLTEEITTALSLTARFYPSFTDWIVYYNIGTLAYACEPA
jgi:hypothetical protein